MLAAASVATCRALVVVSTDDVANLETALLGRAAQADLRVVLRLFDGEFADRVQRAFNIEHSRSVSYLAAPAFAAAMLGRQVIATIPVRRRVLLLAELPVGAGSVAGAQDRRRRSTADHEVPAAGHPHRPDQVLWRPSEGRPLRSTDRCIVVATRAGLSHLLADTAPRERRRRRPVPAARAVARSRTAGPGSRRERPRPRHPPIGPADAGSTGPA